MAPAVGFLVHNCLSGRQNIGRSPVWSPVLCASLNLLKNSAMSKYLDRHGTPLHKDDAVRLEGCGDALEHAEGIVHSCALSCPNSGLAGVRGNQQV